jgi:hypothetical protein
MTLIIWILSSARICFTSTIESGVNKPNPYDGVHVTYDGVHVTYDWVHITYDGVHVTYDWVHVTYDGVHVTYGGVHITHLFSFLCCRITCEINA